MKTAEEFLLEHIRSGSLHGFDNHVSPDPEAVGEVMEQYHQSRLSELKERVERLNTGEFSQYGRAGAGMTKKAVLNLIEQMQE